MSSKLFFTLLGIPLLLCSVGCGLKLGEPPAPEGQVQIDGYSCVNQISKKVGDFFNYRLSEDEVTQFVDCLKKSVSDFSKRVGNKGEAVYSPEDLRSFINLIVKDGNKLSPELLAEFMRLKQTFVGGDVNQITKSDLQSAMNVLDQIKKAALILRPHVKVFNPKLCAQIPPGQIAKELDMAYVALTEVSKIFVSLLKETSNPYSFTDLSQFFEEFRKFIKWYEYFPAASSTENWMKLLKSVKTIATGDDNNVIRREHWEPFLHFLKTSYILYLKTKYGVMNYSVFSGVGLKNFVHVVSDGLFDLTKAISRRSDRKITAPEIEKWTEAMEGMGWIPFGLNAKTAYAGLDLIFTKIFGGKKEFQGIEVAQLLEVSRDFEEWSTLQGYIARKYAPQRTETSLIPKIMSYFEFEDVQDVVAPQDWPPLRRLISERRPIYRDQNPMVFLADAADLSGYGVRMDLYNVSMTHLVSSVLSLIYKSYGQIQDGEPKMSSDSLQKFYEDFYELGVGLKWLDPRSRTAGRRSYIEGNLFTYAANGFSKDYDLDLSEGIDLVAYLLSGGKMTDYIYDDLYTQCEKGVTDIVGKQKLLRTCVNEHLGRALLNSLSNAPNLRAWIMNLSPEDLNRYAELLLNAGFSHANSDLMWVERSELSTIAVIILYSESVLTRFDANRDGRLDDAEVKVPFPLFKEFISGLAKQGNPKGKDLTEDQARSLFEFILYYRRMPESYSDQLSIWWNADENPSYDVNVDRLGLTEAFSVIINKLLNPPTVEPKDAAVRQ